MKKIVRKPKRIVAASKAKKVAPVKKPAKPSPAKPAPKAKQPDKKAPIKRVASEKNVAPETNKLKKPSPAPIVAKKDEKKPAPAPSKVVVKEKVQEKIAVGTKKAEPVAAKASSSTAGATVKAPAPLKVEPKIIETAQPEYKKPSLDGDLFSSEELETFRELLQSERNKILAKARRAMEDGGIQIDKNEMMDEVDQASAMVEQNLMFRLLDRDRKLLSEIDHALLKLDTGEYGYCEGTGEPIPKRRLELRPWCRHSVKFKEKLERMKKSGRGVADEDEV
jgi:DnaK suppressor protein